MVSERERRTSWIKNVAGESNAASKFIEPVCGVESVCVCVECVCVCVWSVCVEWSVCVCGECVWRERERECTCVCGVCVWSGVCVCVESVCGERERESVRVCVSGECSVCVCILSG